LSVDFIVVFSFSHFYRFLHLSSSTTDVYKEPPRPVTPPWRRA